MSVAMTSLMFLAIDSFGLMWTLVTPLSWFNACPPAHARNLQCIALHVIRLSRIEKSDVLWKKTLLEVKQCIMAVAFCCKCNYQLCTLAARGVTQQGVGPWLAR